MELLKPSYEIIGQYGIDMLRRIEIAGRTCYKSEEKIGDNEKTFTFIRGLIKRQHFAMIEHEKITVRFICNRGFTHELVRHRLCSFAQESTRYCDYGKDAHVSFIIPPWVNVEPGVYSQEYNYPFSYDGKAETGASSAWFSTMQHSEYVYKNLRKLGWLPEQARGVLPIDLKTEIVITANLREWRHIFDLRALEKTGKAHPQMKELMRPLLKELNELVPVIFEDQNQYLLSLLEKNL